MEYIGWASAAIVLVMIIILFSKLQIHIYAFHNNDRTEMKLKLKMWGGLISYMVDFSKVQLFINWKMKEPEIVYEKDELAEDGSIKHESEEKLTYTEFYRMLSDANDLLKHVAGMTTVVRRFLKKIVIKEVKWKTAAGSRDAALTGIAAGSIWTVKSSLLGVTSQIMKMKQMPMMHVAPVFGQNILQTEFFCILTLRPGYAIVAGIKILKRWRGTQAKFDSTRLRLLTK